MAGPLLLLGMFGGANVASGVFLNKSAAQDKDLTPKLFGLDARWVLGAGGLVLSVFGPLPLAAAAMGALSASIVNAHSTATTKKGFEAFAEQMTAKLLACQTPGAAPARIPATPEAAQIPMQEQIPLSQQLTLPKQSVWSLLNPFDNQ